jgi:hypothetical protein
MALRDELLRRLRTDLIGPFEETEALPERPTVRYLSGLLWPTRSPMPPEEDESLSLTRKPQILRERLMRLSLSAM